MSAPTISFDTATATEVELRRRNRAVVEDYMSPTARTG